MTINDQWNHFAKQVLPEPCHAIQAREMKRAFFAGFAASLSTFTTQIANLPEDEGIEVMKSLMEQCKGFCIAVELGEA